MKADPKITRKERTRQYYLANRERIAANARERYLANRDELLEKHNLWQKANRDKVNAAAKKWRIKNKERWLRQNRKNKRIWAAKNPERVIELRKKTTEKLRSDVLAAYGGKCQCCGEGIQQFLSIDHIHGAGRKHRREIGKHSAKAFYAWLRANNYPAGFQVLCYNCNCAKGFYGICPHVAANKCA